MTNANPDAWRLTRASVAFCALVFVIGVLDHVGLAPCILTLVGYLGVFILFVVNVVTLPLRWRTDAAGAVLAAIVCMAVLPAVKAAAPYALRARFRWNEAAYEAVATGIRRGAHPVSLGPGEGALGYWVRAERTLADDSGSERAAVPDRRPIVVVHFLAVSHGFAGHVGFARAFDRASDAALRRPHGFRAWKYSRPLGDGWFLVAD